LHGAKLSSVGPGNVSGFNAAVEPAGIDLAMKLHYLRGVYYFERKAFDGATVQEVKDPMFEWLNRYPVQCGRFRREEASERPYIKCNDCGVRFIEAAAGETLDEWLELNDDDGLMLREKLLFSGQIIGPELTFSPLVYIQLTKFRCGGVAVGLSWAHILGDLFSAIKFMNDWARTASGLRIDQPIFKAQDSANSKLTIEPKKKAFEDPLSIKRVDPVGDNWIYSPSCAMQAVSFEIASAQLSLLRAKLQVKSTFEPISAVIWKCIARIRGRETEPRVVTVFKKSDRDEVGDGSILKNTQRVIVAKSEFSVADSNFRDLVYLLLENYVEERFEIEEAMERSDGLDDFVVYGANLSFVNLEDARLYGFVYNRQIPVRVSYRLDGVGENGAILILPVSGGGDGRSVVAILPENEAVKLKAELKKEGLV
ncbi:hypothetical protein M569_10336, partial [Genlisea aurea]